MNKYNFEFYNINNIDPQQIQNRIEFLKNDGDCLIRFSDKFPMFFYEDIFVDKDMNIINSLFEYIEIEPIQKYIEQFIISDTNKVRITKATQTLIW